RPSAGSGLRAAEHDRLRALDLTDLRAVADVELDLALEFQRPIHDGVRADDDLWLVVVAAEPAEARLLDENAAAHMRIGAHRDAAVDRLQAPVDTRALERHGAVGVLDVASHVAAAIEPHAAVHRGRIPRDLHVAPNVHLAVDGFEILDARSLAERDAAVYGSDVSKAAAGTDVDRAVDGFDALGGYVIVDTDRSVDGRDFVDRLTGAHVHAAVHLGKLVGVDRAQGQSEQE